MPTPGLADRPPTARRRRARPSTTPARPTLATAIGWSLDGLGNAGSRRSAAAALAVLQLVSTAAGVTTCASLTPAVVATLPGTLTRLAPATRRHHLIVCRGFLRRAVAAGWVPAACLAALPALPRVHPSGPPPWTAAETARLCAAAPTLRDRALCWVLAATGVRIAEVTAAAVGDWDGAVLTVTGKGGRRRAVPGGPRAAATLTAYLTSRGPLAADAPLVASRQGRLSTRQARSCVYTACERAGLARRGPHSLRHATATRWLRAGVPLVVVSAALGHASVVTTLTHYQQVTAADLRRGLDADPLATGTPAAPAVPPPSAVERAA